MRIICNYFLRQDRDGRGQSKIVVILADSGSMGDFTLTPEFQQGTELNSVPPCCLKFGLHLGLLVILQADLFYQSELGFQPIHMFLFVFEDLFQEFSGDIIPLSFTMGYGLPQ